ncbi:unnamed protein product [Ectocarpus sp. CCAP 1310/34]|nr:unnamed protein product [Ectocarpus sp. CCAP 1310/34]
MTLLSNAAMYHKTWATFVDDAISKHHQSTNDGSAGNSRDGIVGSGRIDLQDVMRVEEILARIERAEGGWIDYERTPDGDDGADVDASSLASGSLPRSSGRKALDTLPPMFQNPGPSFLASMYNPAPVIAYSGKDGPQPNDVKASRSGAKERSCAEDKYLPVVRDSFAVSGSMGDYNGLGGVYAAKEDQLCSSQMAVGSGDGTASEHEGRRRCLESRPGGPETKTEQQPIGRDDLSELMESLHLDGTESGLSTPPPVRGQLEEQGDDLHRGAQQPAGAQALEGPASATSSSDPLDRKISVASAYENEEMFAVSQKHTKGGSNGGGEQVVCPLEQEEEEKGVVRCVAASSSGATPLRPDLFSEDVLMSELSACPDATRIEGEETAHGETTGAEGDKKEEEQSPLFASSEDKSSMIGGVTAVHASPRGVGKSGEEDHLRGAVLSVQRSGVEVGVTVLEGSGYGDSGSGSSRTDLSGEFVAAATAAALVEEDDDVLGAVDGAVDDSQCALVPTPLAGSSSSSSSSAPVNDGAAAAARAIPSGAECCHRSPLQLEFERKVSAAGNGRNGDALSGERKVGADDGDLSDGDRIRFVGSTLNAPDKLLSLLSSPVGNDPTPASVSAPAAGLNGGRPSPHHEPSSQGDARLERRAQAGDKARVDEQAESPEILRLGPASPARERMICHERRPSFDRGFSGVRDVGGVLHGGGVPGNNGASFTLARSPASTRGVRRDQRLRSMLSPDTEGVGFLDGTGGVSSLSPFVLAGSFDVADMGDAGYGSGNGGGWALPSGGGDGDCDLSPVRSATSETTDDVPSPPQGLGTPSSVFPRSGEDMSEDGDTTLTPEVETRLSSSRSPFVVSAGSRLEEEEGGDPGCGNVDASTREGRSTRKQADSGGFMPPPPPRHPSFSPRRTTSKHRERALSFSRKTHEERCATQSSAADTRVVPLRTALGDRTNAAPRGRCDGRSDEEESLPVSTRDGGRCDGGGGVRRCGVAEYSEQASIDSFSESEPGRSKPGVSATEAGADEDMTDGSSLAEGTPRRRGAGARDCYLGGFYPPLQVANLASKAREGLTLSTLQESTLQWMLWRERGEKGGRSAVAAGASVSDDDDDDDDAIDIKGGLLGHLSSEEASACLHALVRAGVTFNDGDGSRGMVGRARRTHNGTGLPCGSTLILAPTKEAAWRWSDRLESGSGGLSVLSYVMPLRERRRLSAKQVAAFDVVVTTYDVLKAKEVPRGVEAKEATSPRSWALPGSTQWRTRNGKEAGQKRSSSSASMTDHMVSLLHGVWWDRVVADGAQILATQRSARAVAALTLAGTARWCLVDCESMSIVEDASDRMRAWIGREKEDNFLEECLAAFLRVPAAVPLVDVAESLFFRSRPRHIAPLYPRAPGAADNSLSLTEGDDSSGCSLRHRRRSSRGANTRRGGGMCVKKRGSGREGRPSEEGKRLSTMEQVGDGGRGWGALPIDGGRSQGTSHAKSRGIGGRREGSPENVERGHGGGGIRRGEDDRGGAASGRQFSRGGITYVPSRLRLRRARGETGPMQVDQK